MGNLCPCPVFMVPNLAKVTASRRVGVCMAALNHHRLAARRAVIWHLGYFVRHHSSPHGGVALLKNVGFRDGASRSEFGGVVGEKRGV